MNDHDLRKLFQVVSSATTFTQINVNGHAMAPLLPKSVEALMSFWKQGLSVIALHGDKIVGHAAIEPLIDDWYELGAVWVDSSMRGSSHSGEQHSHVGLRLYRAILGRHTQKNILATTVNPAAMTIGWRVGMVPVSYNVLPMKVWKATCCCPSEKTQVPTERNVPDCSLREKLCFVRITRETWERIGSPPTRLLPVVPPQGDAPILQDTIRILLAP